MYDGPLIDCDVHHSRVSDRDLLEYLPERWREYALLPGNGGLVPMNPPLMVTGSPDGTNKRLDTFPANGGPPGSDYELMRRQLLDPFRVERALLGFDIGQEASMPNVEFALALCQACNDWSAERWLEEQDDERLCGAILVPVHVPEQAAAEIRRVGQNPKFATAFLAYNGLGQPMGHPVYEPIYEAAAELALPIHLHAGAGEYMSGAHAPHISGGTPHNSRFDVYMMMYQATANHVTSMIAGGVFERYPDLKLLISESGLSWFPWLAASLDSNEALLRRESAWVRRRPSDYLRQHVFITTQPCEANPNDRDEFVAHMSLVDGIEDMLCFSSDYPHWDTDVPTFIEAILPKAWHDKVFHRNARRALRLATTAAVPASV